MRLRLNEPLEKFKEFYGSNLREMPKLLAEGRVPMSVADVMKERLELRHSDDAELRSNWMNNYFDSGDGALYLPDGKLVVAYDSKAIREMTPESKLVPGTRALDLSGVSLRGIKGSRFTERDLGKMIIRQRLTLDQAKDHPIWQALARGDKNLSDAYAEMIFKDHGYDEAMGIWLDSSKSDVPNMRAWCVNRAFNRSDTYGFINLGCSNGRLVGKLASETQRKK